MANHKNTLPDGATEFKNESSKGLLTIRKTDAENQETTLSGAVFQVYGPYESESGAKEALESPSADKLAATLTT